MANKFDVVKVVEGIDYYLLKRLDLTEKEIKALGTLSLVVYGATTLYLIRNITKLHKEIKELKLLKGD
jgi:hypothetical protein